MCLSWLLSYDDHYILIVQPTSSSSLQNVSKLAPKKFYMIGSISHSYKTLLVHLLTLLWKLDCFIIEHSLPILLNWSSLQNAWVNIFQNFYRDGSSSPSYKTLLVHLLTLLCKWDCFIIEHFLPILLKWSSLQNEQVNKPKLFYRNGSNS